MGSTLSSASNEGLIQHPPEKQASKIAPFLRANHKFSIVQKGSQPNPSSQQLVAATFLAVEPISCLFELWDLLSQRALIEVRDNEDMDEIVTSSWKDFVGILDRSDAFVNFFDDEVVRYLYETEQTVKTYLIVPQIQAGLLAKDCWPLRQIAAGIEMRSQEVVTEGLAGTCAYWEPDLEAALNQRPEKAELRDIPTSSKTALQARDRIIGETLLQHDICSLEVVQELVNLSSVGVLWQFLPAKDAGRLWTAVLYRLELAGRTTPPSNDASMTRSWQDIVSKALNEKPEVLQALHLLKQYEQHDPDFRIATRLV